MIIALLGMGTIGSGVFEIANKLEGVTLKMVLEKRAEGIIFLTNCVMGVGLPSDYWLRDWIDRVKNIELD